MCLTHPKYASERKVSYLVTNFNKRHVLNATNSAVPKLLANGRLSLFRGRCEGYNGIRDCFKEIVQLKHGQTTAEQTLQD